MKQIGIFISLFLLSLTVSGLWNVSNACNEVYAKEKVTIRVDGLTCPYCAYSLERNLKELKGVEKVEINLKERTAMLILDEGSALSDEKLREIVKDTGFTPREISREQI